MTPRNPHRQPSIKACILAVLAAALLALILGLSGITAPKASADPVSGCVDEFKLILFESNRRAICDGLLRPDGSWLRAREFYTPRHWVKARSDCYGGSYSSSCTFSPGYWQERSSRGVETYVVTPETVLPDEPGHITNGFVA